MDSQNSGFSLGNVGILLLCLSARARPMANKPKRPRDTNQLAKFTVDVATGEVEPPKLAKAQTRGRYRSDAGEASKAVRREPRS